MKSNVIERMLDLLKLEGNARASTHLQSHGESVLHHQKETGKEASESEINADTLPHL
jgi:hypothetical protein